MSGKPVIHEFIVVEGRDDTTAINRSVIADTIETNGSALSQETIEKIRHAQELRGVIIFTDPDFPGEKIRKQIDSAVPGCKHAFINRQDALPKAGRGLGVEHASSANIREALENFHTSGPPLKNNLFPKIFLFISVFLEEWERKNAEKNRKYTKNWLYKRKTTTNQTRIICNQ